MCCPWNFVPILFFGDGYLPLGIQETPYQQQFVWKTTLGHIFPALKHFPVQDDTYRGFHGFSSDNPTGHHTPSTP